MLGLVPSPQAAGVAARDVYGAPLTGALLASLGMLAFGLLALLPTTFNGVSLLRTLIALPLAAGGIFGVLIGYVSVSTRIEVGADGAVVAAPGWRAGPFPPVQEFAFRWNQVRAVRHRTEVYRIGPLPLRFEVYAIETSVGLIELGSYYLWDLEPVLIDIVHRAECRWCEDGEIEAPLLRTLLHGAPDWHKNVFSAG